MLVLVDFDSLTDRARFDKLFDVSPKAWPDVSVSGHFDGLLLTGMCVFVQCFHSCRHLGQIRKLLSVRVAGFLS